MPKACRRRCQEQSISVRITVGLWAVARCTRCGAAAFESASMQHGPGYLHAGWPCARMQSYPSRRILVITSSQSNEIGTGDEVRRDPLAGQQACASDGNRAGLRLSGGWAQLIRGCTALQRVHGSWRCLRFGWKARSWAGRVGTNGGECGVSCERPSQSLGHVCRDAVIGAAGGSSWNC